MERDGPALTRGPNQPIVYISYSDDSHVHLENVIKFANWLSRNGCDVKFRYSRKQLMLERGLDTWTEHEVLSADFVVLICTKLYREDADRAAGGHVKHEVDLVKHRLSKNRIYSPFLPVLFPGSTAEDVPRCVVQAECYRYCEGSEPEDLLYHVYRKEKLELRQGRKPELKPKVIGGDGMTTTLPTTRCALREDLSHDHVITLEDIRRIYKKISHKWKLVARQLGPSPVSDWQIDGIKTEERDDQARCYEMLKVWVENNKSTGGAKVFELIRVLADADIGLVDAAEAAFGAKAVTKCRRQLTSSR